jgi:hypothetical protein
MIKKTTIVNVPTAETPSAQYLNVEFTDGTFVDLSEEELKSAAMLAEKGFLVAEVLSVIVPENKVELEEVEDE